MDENTRMFPCSCGCSALAVSVDEDLGVTISPWAHVYSDNHSLGAKLRAIFNLLKYGHPYRDFTIHTPDEARKLGRYLLELADEFENTA